MKFLAFFSSRDLKIIGAIVKEKNNMIAKIPDTKKFDKFRIIIRKI